MSRILYGVSGEGSGHSSRARLIAGHLLRQGHQVQIVSYDRGYRNLKDDFATLEITGLTIASRDNRVSKLKTITTNLANLPQGAKTLKKLRLLFDEFSPSVVITDFEPCSAYLAAHHKLPLISLDNQHRLRYMHYALPKDLQNDARLAKTLVKAMIPAPWLALITSFHGGELTNPRALLYPPILREEVLALTPSNGDAVLVYATSGYDSLLKILRSFTRERFVVYGYNHENNEGNLHFKRFSAAGFLQDLTACKAVIATAGFTLISEALHLRKPYLACPMLGQFEQRLNAYMLDQTQLGAQCLTPTYGAVAAFLYDVPKFHEALTHYPNAGNSAICAQLDALLANDGRALASFSRYSRR